MSSRINSHTISHAENIFSGDAYRAGAENDGRGIPRASLVQVDLGAPAVADVNGVVVSESTAAAADYTLDGALVTGGVATFDVPRGVQIVSSGADADKLTFYGTDKYGELMSEEVLLNGTTIVFGKKAFKTITRVASDGANSNNVTIGDSDILGLPFRLENLADVVVIDENDVNLYDVTAITAAAAAAATAAALTENSFDTTPDTTIADCRTPITNINGSGMTTAQEDEVDALFVLVDSNFADVADQINKVVVDVEAIRVEVNKLVTDVGAVDIGALVKSDATAATDLTGDIRGTYNPSAVLDGTKNFKMTYKPQARNSLGAYGVAQFRKAT